MDLIFYNGQKVLDKEKWYYQKGIKLLEQLGLIHDNQINHQISDWINQDKKPYNIYGDDYKIEIGFNIFSKYILSIKDYNENQDIESEITIDFNKDELEQFINLLQIVKNKMK